MKLERELRVWTNKDTGQVKEYYVYYVEVQGIKVELKPQDRTGLQLIEVFYQD